jgi:hypothetical protein
VVIQHTGREERVGAVLAYEGQRFVVGVRKVSLQKREEIKEKNTEKVPIKLQHVRTLLD